MPTAFNLEQALELVRKVGLEPLFTKYEGSQKKYPCKCSCGESFDLLFSTVNRRLKKDPNYQLRCKKCRDSNKDTKYTAEIVLQLFRKHGVEPLFTEEFWIEQSRVLKHREFGRLHLHFRCQCGKEDWTLLENLVTKVNKNPQYLLGCQSCALLKGKQVLRKRTQTKKCVLEYFLQFEIPVLNIEEVEKNTSPIKFYCTCGNIHQTTWMSLQQCRNKPSCETCQIKNKQRGENHPHWNPNLTEEERAQQNSGQKYSVKKWAELIRAIYDYKCQISKKICNTLNCHHIYPAKSHPEKRLVVTNGIPMSQDLHIEFHSRYGRHIDNSADFFRFYKEKTGEEWVPFTKVYPLIVEDASLDLLNMKRSFALRGVDFIPLFLEEVTLKKNILASMLKYRMGLLTEKLNARELVVREIYDTQKVSSFLTQNHRQGEVPSYVNIGLETPQGELVSLMTFGTPRFSKNTKIELLRFCSKTNLWVNGAAQKIFSYFVEKFKPESIITYADIRYSNLDPKKTVYDKLGFIFSHISTPNYWYTKDFITLEPRMKFQKHKLAKLLPSFNPDLTEEENMTLAGYLKVRDCGNHVFLWTPHKQ